MDCPACQTPNIDGEGLMKALSLTLNVSNVFDWIKSKNSLF